MLSSDEVWLNAMNIFLEMVHYLSLWEPKLRTAGLVSGAGATSQV